jgi:chaperonin cofactor prefoldin
MQDIYLNNLLEEIDHLKTLKEFYENEIKECDQILLELEKEESDLDRFL